MGKEFDIPREELISGRDVLRVRCMTINQMESFPSSLKGAIIKHEVDSMAFPKTTKSVSKIIYFILPSFGCMSTIKDRLCNDAARFDCKIMKEKSTKTTETQALTRDPQQTLKFLGLL